MTILTVVTGHSAVREVLLRRVPMWPSSQSQNTIFDPTFINMVMINLSCEWVSSSKVSYFEEKCLVLVRGRWRCNWTLLQIKFHRHRQLSLSYHIVVNIIDDQGVGNPCDGLPGGDHSAGLVPSHPSLRIHCQGIIIIMAYRRLGIFPPDKIPTWWDFVICDVRVTHRHIPTNVYNEDEISIIKLIIAITNIIVIDSIVSIIKEQCTIVQEARRQKAKMQERAEIANRYWQFQRMR